MNYLLLFLALFLFPTLAYSACGDFAGACEIIWNGDCACIIIDEEDCSLKGAFDYCDTAGGGTIELYEPLFPVDVTIPVREVITLSLHTDVGEDVTVKLTDSDERIFIIYSGGELIIDNTGNTDQLIFKGTRSDTGESPGIANGGLIKVLSGGTLTMNCGEQTTSTLPNCKLKEGWVTQKGGALYVLDGGTFNGDYVFFTKNDDFAFFFAGTDAADYTLTNSKWLSNDDDDIYYTGIVVGDTSYCSVSCAGDYTVLSGNLPDITSTA